MTSFADFSDSQKSRKKRKCRNNKKKIFFSMPNLFKSFSRFDQKYEASPHGKLKRF